MSGRVPFTDKPLRLEVVAALATLTVIPADALLLPPKPLALSSSWDCRSGPNSDWLCRKNQSGDYSETLETTMIPVSQEAATDYFAPEFAPKSEAEPVIRTRPVDIMPPPVQYQRPPAPAMVDDTGIVQLLTAPQNSYVLQWLAANSSQALRDLQQRYPVLQQSMIVQYRRNNRDWFVLLDGPFPDRQSASLALNSQPRAALTNKLYPWVRSVAGIKKLDLIRPDNIGEPPWQQNSQQLATNQLTYPQPGIAVATNQYTRSAPTAPSRYNMVQARQRQYSGYGDQSGRFLPPDTPVYEQGGRQPSYPRNNSYNAYSYNEPEYSGYRQPLPESNGYPKQRPQNSNALFASIAPAYPQMEAPVQPQQQGWAPEYGDISYQDGNRNFAGFHEPEYREDRSYRRSEYQDSRHMQPTYNRERTSYSRQRESYRNPARDSSYQRRSYAYAEEPVYRTYQPRDYRYEESYEEPERFYRGNILDAPSGSYTIQWQSSPKRETLERTRRRYSSLREARIIRYRKSNRDWYALVGDVYPGHEAARQALGHPELARIATRLYPRIKTVASLRELVAMSVRRPSTTRSQPANPFDSISSAPKSSYTIQWFAANKPEAVQKMKQRFPELASAVTVHFRRNHRDWYVLVQGQYTDSREALSVIKSPLLKDAVRVLHPWTRPLDSLKNLQIQES